MLVVGEDAGPDSGARCGAANDLKKVVLGYARRARGGYQQTAVGDEAEGVAVEFGIDAHRLLELVVFAQQ